MSSTHSPRRIAPVLGLFMLFGMAFATTTWALRKSLPPGEGELLEGKLAAFVEQDALQPFDVVFLGSSRIYFGVSPAEFDRRTAELGFPTHSFNLGITGQKVHGAYGALRALQARNPRGLKYVLVDPETVSLMLSELPRLMDGQVSLHDIESSRLLLDYIWSSALDPRDKFARSREVLRACAYDTANLGRGLRGVDALMGRATDQERMKFRIGSRADGFRAKDDNPNPQAAEMHVRFLSNQGRWQRQISRFLGERPERVRLHEAGRPLLTRIADLARQMGAEPIFFLSPSMDHQLSLISEYEEGHIRTLFAFNDPERFPELYETDARWEAKHLSAEGARRFSALLAERFTDWLGTSREKPH